MNLFADGYNDYYVVTNTTEQPLFIITNVTEKLIKKDSVEDINYSAKNIDDWKINVVPARFILSPGESKLVYVNDISCSTQENCNRLKDDVFSIGFVPQVYIPEGSKKVDSVGILFGFAPTYVLPPVEQKIDYDIEIKQIENVSNLVFKNKGNSMVTVMLDQCGESRTKESCSTYRQVYADRHVNIPLPEQYKKGNVKIKVLNGQETYIKEYTK